jgi:tetratricopeptide (TPR) repeat protein
MSKPSFLILAIFILYSSLFGQGAWYKQYEKGQQAMEKQQWRVAAEHFRKAIAIKPIDKMKMRTYGMHFIQYFPHRELGICLYNLGEMDLAQRQLNISLKMEPTQRTRDYLKQISGKVPPPRISDQAGIKEDAATVKKAEVTMIKPKTATPEDTEMIVGKQTIKLVGERMGVAVLPFENKGASKDLGDIILDKMINVLVNQERFKVMERAQLDKVVAEQSLGVSGIIDAATAAEIGKGIGVDGIIIGSVAAARSGALSIDARVIDTESAAIIVAKDAYSGSSDAQSVKNTIENLAHKITESLPLVEGYIIRIDGEQVILDVGRNGGLNRGIKCHIYKEGESIKHPITGEILGKETQILGEVLVTEAFDKYSVAKTLTTEGGMLTIGDKFLTK